MQRAPVCPFATRGALEQTITGLIDKGTVLELSPPSEWRIHSSTEANGFGFQHERLAWGINDWDEWATVKIRQHAIDPSRTAGRTGFEGKDVANLNFDLAKVLRCTVIGGGQPRDRPTTSRQDPNRKEDGKIRGSATSIRPFA